MAFLLVFTGQYCLLLMLSIRLRCNSRGSGHGCAIFTLLWGGNCFVFTFSISTRLVFFFCFGCMYCTNTLGRSTYHIKRTGQHCPAAAVKPGKSEERHSDSLGIEAFEPEPDPNPASHSPTQPKSM
ncbi:hypothetical protein BZA05DRAFT_160336 [Tricharina praecox]|uniref:uncharacterized protein n=1 Tax=Tricharina praecox TaxID=43433 RepID=UPI00221E42C9|nr:uncharacterized protein BZA05DRAFT_160336 [Tricharina praecox]KAI5856834.1 hypothetical protein BZA05DRAFT_160336 [Tricharina praecox]